MTEYQPIFEKFQEVMESYKLALSNTGGKISSKELEMIIEDTDLDSFIEKYNEANYNSFRAPAKELLDMVAGIKRSLECRKKVCFQDFARNSYNRHEAVIDRNKEKVERLEDFMDTGSGG